MKSVWTESKPAVNIPDGNHTGIILKIEDRPETPDNAYHYIDIVVKIDGTEQEIKYGCPFRTSDKSKLGKLILAFGVKPSIGQELDFDQIFLNKKVSFITLKQDMYSEIVEGSLRPLV